MISRLDLLVVGDPTGERADVVREDSGPDRFALALATITQEQEPFGAPFYIWADPRCDRRQNREGKN
jgi:hypothetical protein